jgi:hypothetical protein
LLCSHRRLPSTLHNFWGVYNCYSKIDICMCKFIKAIFCIIIGTLVPFLLHIKLSLQLIYKISQQMIIQSFQKLPIWCLTPKIPWDPKLVDYYFTSFPLTPSTPNSDSVWACGKFLLKKSIKLIFHVFSKELQHAAMWLKLPKG